MSYDVCDLHIIMYLQFIRYELHGTRFGSPGIISE
jgi:hypothetical protein